jgi:quinol-cytochrome oxidoreductase complex cytochrome b subunit
MTLRQSGLALWQRAERGLDAPFGGALNPLRHLGALGFLCFWLLALSGIYLYAVLDTSAEGAYRSIDALSGQPWYLGGWLRSLHRYAADAFVIAMLAHLLREWLLGRYSGFRRFSWLTGVPLLLFAFASAIVGFWLNWAGSASSRRPRPPNGSTGCPSSRRR